MVKFRKIEPKGICNLQIRLRKNGGKDMMEQTSNKKVKSAKRMIILAELLFMVTASLLTAGCIQLKEVFNDKVIFGDVSVLVAVPIELSKILVIYGSFITVSFVLAVSFWKTGKKKISECIQDKIKYNKRIYEECLKKYKRRNIELETEIKASGELRISIATSLGFKDILKKDSIWEILKLLLTQNFEKLQEDRENLTNTIEETKDLLYQKYCEVKELNEQEKHQLEEFINSYSTLFDLEALENYLFGDSVIPEYQKLVFAKVPEIVLPKAEGIVEGDGAIDN